MLVALALRLVLVYTNPHVAGDSEVYEKFAQNLLKFGTYSHLDPEAHAALTPTLIRVPGYPILMAAVFALAGIGNLTAVRVTQCLLDTFTCLLIGLIAFEISAGGQLRRRRMAQWALLLAALCPFIGNYAASILTEVPTTLLWTAATLFGLKGLKNDALQRNWLYCGLLAGVATLFRPESGILIGIFGFVLLCRQIRLRLRRPLISGTALLSVGLLVALAPWAIRNAISLHTFQMLAPTYAQDKNEEVTLGYFNWCRTWLWTYHDIAYYLWPLEYEAMPLSPPPAWSVDNDSESKTVLALYERHNLAGNYLAPESDKVFARLASDHRSRHPFRYYAALPFLRSLAMWFSPRVEILQLQPNLLPLKESWRENPRDFSIGLFLYLLNTAYIVLAIAGAASVVRRSRSFENFETLACFALAAMVILRTAFLSYFFFPEPRYILETYPCLLIFGAFVFAKKQALE